MGKFVFWVKLFEAARHGMGDSVVAAYYITQFPVLPKIHDEVVVILLPNRLYLNWRNSFLKQVQELGARQFPYRKNLPYQIVQ